MMEGKFFIRRYALRALPLIVILALCTSAFAAEEWAPAVGASLLVALFLVAIAYMAVHAMHIESYKPLLRDEVGQILMTAVIAGVIIFGAASFDGMVKKGVYGLSQPGKYCTGEAGQFYCQALGAGGVPKSDLRDWAISLNKKNAEFVSGRTRDISFFVNRVGQQSSQSGLCNMLGIGFTIAGCSSWGILRAPGGQLLNALAFASMDLRAQYILLEAAKSIALPLLLPLGVLLRAIYFTRQAGSAIIALAISLYFIFPGMVLAGQAAADAFLHENPKYGQGLNAPSESYKCDPFDPDVGSLASQMHGIILKGSPSLDEKIIFWVIGRYLLLDALALTGTLAAVRGIGHALGTEINVMQIARLS